MEQAAATDPCLVAERDRVEDERVAFPTSHRISEERDVVLRVLAVRPVVGRNDAILAVTAAGIASGVNKDDVLVRLQNPSRLTLTRDTEGQTRHDRVVLVRPHVELLDLVPVLRFVHGTTKVPEPGRRVELEVIRLIDGPVASSLLCRTAAASAPGHVVADPVG